MSVICTVGPNPRRLVWFGAARHPRVVERGVEHQLADGQPAARHSAALPDALLASAGQKGRPRRLQARLPQRRQQQGGHPQSGAAARELGGHQPAGTGLVAQRLHRPEFRLRGQHAVTQDHQLQQQHRRRRSLHGC